MKTFPCFKLTTDIASLRNSSDLQIKNEASFIKYFSDRSRFLVDGRVFKLPFFDPFSVYIGDFNAYMKQRRLYYFIMITFTQNWDGILFK